MNRCCSMSLHSASPSRALGEQQPVWPKQGSLIALSSITASHVPGEDPHASFKVLPSTPTPPERQPLVRHALNTLPSSEPAYTLATHSARIACLARTVHPDSGSPRKVFFKRTWSHTAKRGSSLAIASQFKDVSLSATTASPPHLGPPTNRPGYIKPLVAALFSSPYPQQDSDDGRPDDALRPSSTPSSTSTR